MQSASCLSQYRNNSCYQCCSAVHIPGVLVAVRTEIHAARDTREWALVVISDAAFEAFLFLTDLQLERFTDLS